LQSTVSFYKVNLPLWCGGKMREMKRLLLTSGAVLVAIYALATMHAENNAPKPTQHAEDNASKATPQAEDKTPKPPPPMPEPGQEVSEEVFKYLDKKLHYDCQKAIKKLVKFDIRAPGVIYGTNQGEWAFLRFTRWSKYASPHGTIRLAGDDAELQNGLGAWVRHNYSCIVDPKTMQVEDASLDPGKLP
jgi:hypothetical protein